MSLTNKDTLIGKVKEGAGKLTGDKGTEAEGKLQGAFGKAKEAVEEKVHDVAEKVDETVDKLTKKK